METSYEAEESLREACALGDLAKAQLLLEKSISVNCQNKVNGWAPLHWAAHRGHSQVVDLLIQQGANSTLPNSKGQSPLELTRSEAVARLLGGTIASRSSFSESEQMHFVPSYLQYPEFFYAHDSASTTNSNSPKVVPISTEPSGTGELVLKVRIAGRADEDFIEVELDRSTLTYDHLVDTCCHELEIQPILVEKIRKLPNTILRKDKEVQRLSQYQEIELVLLKKSIKSASTSTDPTFSDKDVILY